MNQQLYIIRTTYPGREPYYWSGANDPYTPKLYTEAGAKRVARADLKRWPVETHPRTTEVLPVTLTFGGPLCLL